MMEFGAKIILFHPLARDEKHRGAHNVPGVQGPQPCSHVGREEEVVPTLVRHMGTL